MRLKIVAGNWKMNNDVNEALALINSTLEFTPHMGSNQLNLFAVPFPYLMIASELVRKYKSFAIAAQNCSSFTKGAYTGEVSASMLASLNITYCLVGHSERRTLFNEKEQTLLDKLNQLLQHNIKPIWCCGEHFEDRSKHNFFNVIANQLHHEVFKLDKVSFSKVVIAYEPVWAIGTGLTASAAQAQEMHQFIRSEIANKYGIEVADQTSILYGGSCNADNAKQLFSLADVDGGLIGGASLHSESFVKLISTMYELH
jgi:triosephosphate isomerase (TIM)